MKVTGVLLVLGLAAVFLASNGTRLGAAPTLQTSCFTYGATQSQPPEKIRVYRVNLGRVDEVDFKTYVKNVVPREFASGWPPAANMAGSLAVKYYGWFLVVNWEGGSLDGACYHVWDSQRHQVYVPGSNQRDTDYAVEQTWNWALHSGGSIYL